MMKKSLLLLFLITLALAPTLRRASASQETQKSEAAQTQPSPEHFSKDGLAFDYPAGWSLSDRSTRPAQHLILSREGSSALIMVIAYRDRLENGQQLVGARETITKPYVEDLARKLGVQKIPVLDSASPCVEVAGQLATGVRLAGKSSGLPSTGEVYSVVLGGRFVNLVYIRNDKDYAESAPAWKGIQDTLKIDTPPGAKEFQTTIVSGGVLNDKAIKKPLPAYPPRAFAARQHGVVTVLITVDEEGKVTNAQAVSGGPLLLDAAQLAAYHATFAPTVLCGHPVKVSGVVTYNFILQ